MKPTAKFFIEMTRCHYKIYNMTISEEILDRNGIGGVSESVKSIFYELSPEDREKHLVDEFTTDPQLGKIQEITDG
jgi:hypothetical protein